MVKQKQSAIQVTTQKSNWKQNHTDASLEDDFALYEEINLVDNEPLGSKNVLALGPNSGELLDNNETGTVEYKTRHRNVVTQR